MLLGAHYTQGIKEHINISLIEKSLGYIVDAYCT